MDGISTLLTTKPRLREAISRFDMFTLRTHLRGMLGVDNLEQHAGLFRLVADKQAKLVESPATDAVALRLAKPGSLSDALEVFKGYSSQSAFSLRNDSLREAVVGVAAKPRFSIADAFELLADALAPSVVGRQISRRLKGLPERLVLDAHLLYVLARVYCSIRVRGQMLDPQIDAEEIVGIQRRQGIGLDHGHQEPLAILAMHQFGVVFDLGKLLGLVVAHDHRQADAPIQRGHGDRGKILVAQQMPVIGHRRQGTKGHLLGGIPLVGSRYIGRDQTGHLSRQAKAFTQLVVIQLVQAKAIGQLALKSANSQPGTRLVESTHRLLQRRRLLSRRLKLYLYHLFHKDTYSLFEELCQPLDCNRLKADQPPVAG